MGYAKFRKNTYSFQVLSILDTYLFVLSGYAPPKSLYLQTNVAPPEVGCHRASPPPPRWLRRGSSWQPTKTLEVRNIVMVADPRRKTEKQRRHPETISAAVCLCGFFFQKFDLMKFNEIHHFFPKTFIRNMFGGLFSQPLNISKSRGECEFCMFVFFRKGFRKLTLQKGLGGGGAFFKGIRSVWKTHCSFYWTCWFLGAKKILGGGFTHCLFSSLFGDMIEFDQYLSDGLKPPTWIFYS